MRRGGGAGTPRGCRRRGRNSTGAIESNVRSHGSPPGREVGPSNSRAFRRLSKAFRVTLLRISFLKWKSGDALRGPGSRETEASRASLLATGSDPNRSRALTTGASSEPNLPVAGPESYCPDDLDNRAQENSSPYEPRGQRRPPRAAQEPIGPRGTTSGVRARGRSPARPTESRTPWVLGDRSRGQDRGRAERRLQIAQGPEGPAGA